MNPTLHQYVDICVRRTTNSLRWIGTVLAAFFAVVFLVATYSMFAATKMTSGMFVGLVIIAACAGSGYAVIAHAERVQKRLEHVFFEAPEKVFKIEAKVSQNGPITSYMFHLHSPKPVKLVGISVPSQAMFNALRELLPQHFPNANKG